MSRFEDKFLNAQFIKNTPMQSVAERSSKFLQRIKKPQRGGASVNEPFVAAGPPGQSYDFAAAQAGSEQTNYGSGDNHEFVTPFGQYFGAATVSARAVAGSKGNEDAYLQQMSLLMKTKLKAFGTVAARKLLGPVGQNIGRIADKTAGADGEMTLYLRNDTFNCFKGQILQAADGDGDGAPSNLRSGLGYVTGTDPDSTTNMVTIATASDGSTGIPSGWANDDYIFRYGDVGATDLSDKQILSLQRWNTLTAPSGAFNGVTRTGLRGSGGFRLSASDVAGLSIKERIELLVAEGQQYGAMEVDLITLGNRGWMQLSQEIQDTGWQNFGKVMEVGAGSLVVMTPGGPVEVINDVHQAESDIFAWTSDSLFIYTYNGFPGPVDEDGLKLLRKATSMDYEIRWQAFNAVTVGGQPNYHGRCSSGVLDPAPS